MQVTSLADGTLALSFEPAQPNLEWEELRLEESRVLLAAFLQACPDISEHTILPVRASPTGHPAPWARRLRAEFVARYGPPHLPIPDSLQSRPLFLALKLSPRYMGRGIRDAARELFSSPAFLVSVTLSILVYFSAWILPEPLFSKAFAATLTARLALAVGLLELRNIAHAFLQLYREAKAARSMKEVEAVAERFGRALGGTALRVLVMAASLGAPKACRTCRPGASAPC